MAGACGMADRRPAGAVGGIAGAARNFWQPRGRRPSLAAPGSARQGHPGSFVAATAARSSLLNLTGSTVVVQLEGRWGRHGPLGSLAAACFARPPPARHPITSAFNAQARHGRAWERPGSTECSRQPRGCISPTVGRVEPEAFNSPCPSREVARPASAYRRLDRMRDMAGPALGTSRLTLGLSSSTP